MAKELKDDDDISITSTAISEQKDEYEIEGIVAERRVDGMMQYLVRWEGYPLERSTWEAIEAFTNPKVTLADWGETKQKIARGEIEAVDVDALQQQVFKLEDEKEDRRRRRRAKRKRLGLPVIPDPSPEHAEGEHTNYESGGEILDKPKGASSWEHHPVQPPPGQPKSPWNKENAVSRSPSSQLQKPKGQGAPKPHQSYSSISMTTGSRKDSGPARGSVSGPAPIRAHKRIQESQGKRFHRLSTQRKFEKRLKQDNVPDISQLNLRDPKNWVRSRDERLRSDSDSLFVDQGFLSKNSPTLGNTPPKAEFSPRFSPPPPRRPSAPPVRRISPPSYRWARPYPQRIPSPPGRRYVQHGTRFWDPGEVLVIMYFKGRKMAEVRFVHMDHYIGGRLLKLRAGLHIRIDFTDTCTVDEYTKLCQYVAITNGPDERIASGWVRPFHDNVDDVNKLAHDLREERKAAIFYPPSSDYVLMIYPSQCHDWSFLDGGWTSPPYITLRLVARTRVPFLKDVLPPGTARDVPQEVEDDHVDQDHTNDDDKAPPALRIAPEMPSTGPKAPLLPEGLDLVAFFHGQGITLDMITKVNRAALKRGHATYFFLYFPPEVEDEFKIMEKFLRLHPGTQIFSNLIASADWERFINMRSHGTIFFHHSFTGYHKLYDLRRAIRYKPFLFFTISIQTPLHAGSSIDIEPIFPDGGVILITEDMILRDPAPALKVIDYKINFLKDRYKLFLRPNIRNWLLDLIDKRPDEKNLFQLWCLLQGQFPPYSITNLNNFKRDGSPDSLDGWLDDDSTSQPIISHSYIPGYGSRREEDHPQVPRGLTQEGRNADHLVEYFAGWALSHLNEGRRFIVVTSIDPPDRWLQWNHLEVYNFSDFNKQIDASITARKPPGPENVRTS